MNMEKWALFASHWKSRKLLLMLITMFCWTVALPKKVWEAFWANPCLQRRFLACVILESFVNFLDDPYYEPLPWFMISVTKLNFSIYIVILLYFHEENNLETLIRIINWFNFRLFTCLQTNYCIIRKTSIILAAKRGHGYILFLPNFSALA